MQREFRTSGSPPQEYTERVSELANKSPVIPKVNIFNLSNEGGWEGFSGALLKHSQSKPTERLVLLNEALDSGIYIDRFREYLTDLYKLDRPPGITLEDYIERNDTWENSVVVERSWKERKERFVRIPREEEFERIARSRNTLIISPETQTKLREQTFVIGGMGVGSAVGYLLVLNGARNFKVADGGNLEAHNLNRFIGSDVGKIGQNLAVLWAQMAYEANPFVNIQCKPKKLSKGGDDGTIKIDEFLSGATMAIEEMDDLQAKRYLREAAVDLGLPVLMVTDLARKGGRVAFARAGRDHILKRFTPETISMIQDAKTDRVAKTKIAIDVFIGRKAPREHLDPLVESSTQLPFWPQSGISAFISAAGGVNTIIDYLEGRKVPRERTLNLWRTKKSRFRGKRELFSRHTYNVDIKSAA